MNNTEEERKRIKKLKKEQNTLEDIINLIEPIYARHNCKIDKYITSSPKIYPIILRDYSNRATMKILTHLRKKIPMDYKDANLLYSDTEYLHQKCCEIMDLISTLNDEYEVNFIIDKQTVCAFLRISVADYQYFLNNYSFPEMQIEFQNIEDMLISIYQQSAETGTRNLNAVLKRLQSKGKYGGHDVEYESSKKSNNNAIDISYDEKDTQKKLDAKYNW